MTWTMKSFISQPMKKNGCDWISSSLPGFVLAEPLTEMDWSRPCVEWWELPIRGEVVDEFVCISSLRLSPGYHRVMRAPAYGLRFMRNLTRLTGGFGGGAVVDTRSGETGRGLFYAGCTIELLVGKGEELSLVRGRQEGGVEHLLHSMEPDVNFAIWDDWMRWVTGLSAFDFDHARVRRPPRRHVYALSANDALSAAFEEGDESTRSVVAVTLEHEPSGDPFSALSGVVGVSWHRTPPRRTLHSFQKSKRSFALIQIEGELRSDELDGVCRELACDAVAVQISGEGKGVCWWDWMRGIPAHQGEVRGAHDFLEVWMAQAVAMDTNPLVFSAPWGTEISDQNS